MPADSTAARPVRAARAAGIALAALGLAGAAHGVRASIAHGLYHQAKYGAAREHPPGIFRRCVTARRLYPWNYWFCIWSAETAYYSSDLRGGRDAAEFERIARHWCDAGLALNPFKSQLRLLKARLLREESPRAAAAFWAEYVDWDYWNPHNHAMLVEFYCDAGLLERAVEPLLLLKGREYEDEARRTFRDAWLREKTMPPGLPPPPGSAPRR